MKKCKMCGSFLSNNATVCPRCGVEVKEDEIKVEPVKSEENIAPINMESLKDDNRNVNNFCSNCGNKMTETVEQNNNASEVNQPQQTSATMSEMMSKKSQNFIKPIIQKIKNFIVKYNNILSIILYGKTFCNTRKYEYGY